MITRGRVGWSVGALLAAVAAGVLLMHWPRPQRSSLLPLVIACLKMPHGGLLHIAMAEGYFRQAGLAPSLLTLPGYQGIKAVSEGRADVAETAETPIARWLDEGRKFKVIATMFTSRANTGIIARRDRGIAEPADLAGKRIGFVPITSMHYQLELFLAFNNIPLTAVVLVPLKLDEMVSALMSGQVDAASYPNPVFAQVRHDLGDNAAAFPTSEIYSVTDNLVIADGAEPARDEKIERMLPALARAEDFARLHPEQAARIITSVTGANPALFRQYWDATDYELTLSQSLLLEIENEAIWYLRRGLVPDGHYPNILAAFDVDYLRRVKPLGISVVK